MTDSPASRRFGAFIEVLFSHDGRIGRLSYWLGLTGIAGVTAAAATIADGVVHGTGDIGRYVAFGLIVGLLIWMHSAVTIKRLHDRDRVGLWYFLHGLAPAGLFLWAIYLQADDKATAAWLLYVLTVAASLAVMVELGLMRGSVGPNRFGRDPAP